MASIWRHRAGVGPDQGRVAIHTTFMTAAPRMQICRVGCAPQGRARPDRTGPAANPRGEQMKVLGRARMAGAAVAAAAVIGGGGFALGAVTAEPGRAAAGPGIVSVTPGGPADRAGLRAGDVIQAVGQTRTPDATALTGALAARDSGQRVP